jgi:conjugative transfer region protein (TIGR03750 family)
MSQGGHPDPATSVENPRVLTRARHAPITDRVNAEPAIVNGMTASEGGQIAVACLLLYGAMGGILTLLTGWWHIALFLILFGSGATLWFGSLYLAKVKRGRPAGFYVQAIQLWLVRHRLTTTVLLRHANYWSVGREMPFGGFTSPLVVRERVTPQVKPQRVRAASSDYPRPQS